MPKRQKQKWHHNQGSAKTNTAAPDTMTDTNMVEVVFNGIKERYPRGGTGIAVVTEGGKQHGATFAFRPNTLLIAVQFLWNLILHDGRRSNQTPMAHIAPQDSRDLKQRLQQWTKTSELWSSGEGAWTRATQAGLQYWDGATMICLVAQRYSRIMARSSTVDGAPTLPVMTNPACPITNIRCRALP